MHKYYCIKCKKHHHRGKIYKDHLKYKKKEAQEEHRNRQNEKTKISYDDLRPIAKRQLRRLYRKMKLTGNHELYKQEIVKLIENEKRR